jgi:integrase
VTEFKVTVIRRIDTMKKPEPWYWEARRGWYVQINKKQVKLGGDDNPKPKSNPRPPDEIMREYYRVMGASGLSPSADRLRAKVPEVCEMLLEAKAGIRQSSLDKYAEHFRNFSAPYFSREFRTIRKDEIVKVAESNPKWGETSKYHFIKCISMLFTWARDAGYLEFNPLAGWENPYVPTARTRGMTEAEFTAISDRSRDLEFKQAMSFLRGTGCRPGELCSVEARHVHPDRPLVTLEASLHKTGRKTKRARVLVMPTDVEAMVRDLARRYPEGQLFRNTRGTGMRIKSIQIRVRRYRRALGLSEDVVPYLIRHATLSRLLDGGTDAHLAAKIAGHAGTTTLQATYYHPDVNLMIEASNKASERKKG